MRSDNSGRGERTRPGFYFMFCVRQSSVRGCRFSVMFVYFVIKMCLNVHRFPPPSSRTYQLRYIGAENPGRKEGHAVREPSLLSGIAVLRRSGSRKKRRSPVAARSGGAGAKEEQVGRKTRCRAPGSRRGGCRPRGSGGVAPVRLEAEACCHPPCLGRSRERGTRCRLPSTGGATAVRQEAEEHRAVHQRCPVPSHGTASEPLSWLRTERQCVRERDRDIFFFSSLPSLFSVTPHPSVSFSLASSVLTPRYAAAALTGSPRERGEGGSRAQSRGYPPACEGRWGYVASGAGPRAVGTERGRWSNW